jgi:hypothetical protein
MIKNHYSTLPCLKVFTDRIQTIVSFSIFTKKYTMKNTFKIIAWLSGAVGMILMLLGIIAVLAGDRFMGHFWSNYFYPSYNFIQLGIFFFLAMLVGNMRKD